MDTYKLPNGRLYRVGPVFDSENTTNPYEEPSCFVLQQWLTAAETDPQFHPDGLWAFLVYTNTLEDALQTLCLFGRHPSEDITWLNQFKVGGDT